MSKKGFFVVVSGPSGSGKTTLCRRYAGDYHFHYGVSHTTRPMRPSEIDGKDYYFLDVETFRKMVDEDAFLEHACVYDNFYGTSREEVDFHRNSGQGVILDVDTQGAMSIKEKCPDAMLIFVKAPSMDELQRRLVNRRTDSKEIVDKRLKKAKDEEAFTSEYDVVLVNDDLDRAYMELEKAIEEFHKDRT